EPARPVGALEQRDRLPSVADPFLNPTEPGRAERQQGVHLAHRWRVAALPRCLEGTPQALLRPLVIAEEAIGVAEAEVIGAGYRGIAEPVARALRREEQLHDLLEPAEMEEGVRLTEDDVQDPTVPLPAPQPLGMRRGFLERGDRFAVRVDPRGPLGKAGE